MFGFLDMKKKYKTENMINYSLRSQKWLIYMEEELFIKTNKFKSKWQLGCEYFIFEYF